MPVEVPQYVIADALLYDQIGSLAAQTLRSEQGLHVLDVPPLMAQAKLLCRSTARVRDDLKLLRRLDLLVNPAALPGTAQAMAEVAAANAAALKLNSVLATGNMGPGYLVLTQDVTTHLGAGREILQGVSKSYNSELDRADKKQ